MIYIYIYIIIEDACGGHRPPLFLLRQAFVADVCGGLRVWGWLLACGWRFRELLVSFWLPLGLHFGTILASFWCLVRWSPLWYLSGSLLAPFWTMLDHCCFHFGFILVNFFINNWLKIELVFRLRFCIDFLWFLDNFWLHFGIICWWFVDTFFDLVFWMFFGRSFDEHKCFVLWCLNWFVDVATIVFFMF